MDNALRNGLWNLMYQSFWQYQPGSGRRARGTFGGDLLCSLWAYHFDQPIDEAGEFFGGLLGQVKERYMAAQWFDVYDFVAFVLNHLAMAHKDDFAAQCNRVLETHLSAYRFVGLMLVPITSEEEILAVEQAMSHGDKFRPITTHLDTALARLGDRPTPDCRNSIKESISAVEAVCQIITGDANATLGKALKLLGIHPALKQGFSKIYDYTSDASGIRHALSDAPTVDADDAKFFLVSCSAFVNYLISKFSVPGAADLPA
jgi:hypothetical protein